MRNRSCAEMLKEEFEKRKRQNPRLSLRGFARLMNISPATLSQVMSGARNLGPRSALNIANRCEFSEEKRSKFLSASIGTEIQVSKVGLNDSDFQMLEPEDFDRIATWKHYAVLCLGELAKARFDPVWVGQSLDVPVEEAEELLNQLHAMGYIAVMGDYFKPSVPSTRTRTDVPSSSIRRFHSQLMRKAEQSLDRFEVDDRDITAIVVPVNSARLRVAKKKIKAFRRSLMGYLSEGAKNQVYAMQISLFPLTEKTKQEPVLKKNS